MYQKLENPVKSYKNYKNQLDWTKNANSVLSNEAIFRNALASESKLLQGTHTILACDINYI